VENKTKRRFPLSHSFKLVSLFNTQKQKKEKPKPGGGATAPRISICRPFIRFLLTWPVPRSRAGNQNRSPLARRNAFGRSTHARLLVVPPRQPAHYYSRPYGALSLALNGPPLPTRGIYFSSYGADSRALVKGGPALRQGSPSPPFPQEKAKPKPKTKSSRAGCHSHPARTKFKVNGSAARGTRRGRSGCGTGARRAAT